MLIKTIQTGNCLAFDYQRNIWLYESRAERWSRWELFPEGTSVLVISAVCHDHKNGCCNDQCPAAWIDGLANSHGWMLIDVMLADGSHGYIELPANGKVANSYIRVL